MHRPSMGLQIFNLRRKISDLQSTDLQSKFNVDETLCLRVVTKRNGATD
jgi:hypothetical protein